MRTLFIAWGVTALIALVTSTTTYAIMTWNKPKQPMRPVRHACGYMIMANVRGAIYEIQLLRGKMTVTGEFKGNLPTITPGDNLGFIAIYGEDDELVHVRREPLISNFALDPHDSLSINLELEVHEVRHDNMERWILSK